MRGKLIVFEGVEGCGKTTQIERSRLWLQDRGKAPVVVTREPGGTELGVALRHLLLAEQQHPIFPRAELLLYAADRAQHIEETIEPHLSQGAIVLCDRYTDSTVAYQGYGRGLSLELIERLNRIATSGTMSDLTLWLDVEVEIGLARAKARGKIDRFEQTELDFHRRVQQGYKELAQKYPHRIVRIDASRSEVEVQAQIQEICDRRGIGHRA
ncbi:MAG: dTMP kinase [Cyanosarcina radialis HA8281-LM2]|jgi:dTMP kinase|nr:dTMP kinase [Cyanosarcina radialis HA8281-LM2]